jgi:hypothetical protein
MESLKTKTLAEIYIRQGHLQEAFEIYRALAEKDPGDRDAREKLKYLSQRLGFLSSGPSTARSKEEKTRVLEGWLANIQNRRKR